MAREVSKLIIKAEYSAPYYPFSHLQTHIVLQRFWPLGAAFSHKAVWIMLNSHNKEKVHIHINNNKICSIQVSEGKQQDVSMHSWPAYQSWGHYTICDNSNLAGSLQATFSRWVKYFTPLASSKVFFFISFNFYILFYIHWWMIPWYSWLGSWWLCINLYRLVDIWNMPDEGRFIKMNLTEWQLMSVDSLILSHTCLNWGA